MAGNVSKSMILNDCTSRSFNKSNFGVNSSLPPNASIENETLLSGNSDISLRQVIGNTSFLKVGCSETSITDLFPKTSLFVMKKKIKLSSSHIQDSSPSLTFNGLNSSPSTTGKKRIGKVEVLLESSSQESLISSQESTKSTKRKRKNKLKTSSSNCDSLSFPTCEDSLDKTQKGGSHSKSNINKNRRSKAKNAVKPCQVSVNFELDSTICSEQSKVSDSSNDEHKLNSEKSKVSGKSSLNICNKQNTINRKGQQKVSINFSQNSSSDDNSQKENSSKNVNNNFINNTTVLNSNSLNDKQTLISSQEVNEGSCNLIVHKTSEANETISYVEDNKGLESSKTPENSESAVPELDASFPTVDTNTSNIINGNNSTANHKVSPVDSVDNNLMVEDIKNLGPLKDEVSRQNNSLTVVESECLKPPKDVPNGMNLENEPDTTVLSCESSLTDIEKNNLNTTKVRGMSCEKSTFLTSIQSVDGETLNFESETLQTKSLLIPKKHVSVHIDLELTDLEDCKLQSPRKILAARKSNDIAVEHSQEVQSLKSQTINSLPLNDTSTLMTHTEIIEPLGRKNVSVPIDFDLQVSETEKTVNSIENTLKLDKTKISGKGNNGVIQDSTNNKSMPSVSSICDPQTIASTTDKKIPTRNVSVPLDFDSCTISLSSSQRALENNNAVFSIEDKTDHIETSVGFNYLSEEENIRILGNETLNCNQINKNKPKVSINMEFDSTFMNGIKPDSITCSNNIKDSDSDKEPEDPVKGKNSCDSKLSSDKNDPLLSYSGYNGICDEKKNVTENLKDPNLIKKCLNNDTSVNHDLSEGTKTNSNYIIERSTDSIPINVQNIENSQFNKSDSIISKSALENKLQMENNPGSHNVDRNLMSDEINSYGVNETYTINSNEGEYSGVNNISEEKKDELSSDIQIELEKFENVNLKTTDNFPNTNVVLSHVIPSLSTTKVSEANEEEYEVFENNLIKIQNKKKQMEEISIDSSQGSNGGNGISPSSTEIQEEEELSNSNAKGTAQTLAINSQECSNKNETSVSAVENSKNDLDFEQKELCCVENIEQDDVSVVQKSKNVLFMKNNEQKEVSYSNKESSVSSPTHDDKGDTVHDLGPGVNEHFSLSEISRQTSDEELPLSPTKVKQFKLREDDHLQELSSSFTEEVNASVPRRAASCILQCGAKPFIPLSENISDGSINCEKLRTDCFEEPVISLIDTSIRSSEFLIKDNDNVEIHVRPITDPNETKLHKQLSLSNLPSSHNKNESEQDASSCVSNLNSLQHSSKESRKKSDSPKNLNDSGKNMLYKTITSLELTTSQPADMISEINSRDSEILIQASCSKERTKTSSRDNQLPEEKSVTSGDDGNTSPDRNVSTSSEKSKRSKYYRTRKSVAFSAQYDEKENVTKWKRKSVTFASTAQMRSDSHNSEIALNSSPNLKSKANYNGNNMSTVASQSVVSDFDLSMTEALSVIKREDPEIRIRRKNCHSTPVKKDLVNIDQRSKEHNDNHIFLCPELPLRKSRVSTADNFSDFDKKRSRNEAEGNEEDKTDKSNDSLKRKKMVDKTINELSYDTLLDVSEIPPDKTMHQKKIIYHSTPINAVLEKKRSEVNITGKGRGSSLQHKDQMIQVSKTNFGTSSEITCGFSGKKSISGLSTSYSYGHKRKTVTLNSTTKRSRQDRTDCEHSSVKNLRSYSTSNDSIKSSSQGNSGGTNTSNEESSIRVLRSGSIMSTLTQSTDNICTYSKVSKVRFRDGLSYVDSTPSTSTSSESILSQNVSDSRLKGDKDIFDVTADTPTLYSMTQEPESSHNSDTKTTHTGYCTPSNSSSIPISSVHTDQSKMSVATLSSVDHQSLKKSLSRLSEYSLNTPQLRSLRNKNMQVLPKENILGEPQLHRKKAKRHCLDSERFLIDGKIYVPPIVKFKEKWISKELFKFCTNRLKDKFDLEAPVITERVISHLCSTVSAVEALSNYTDVNAQTLVLKNILKKYDICSNMLEYSSLIMRFTPFSFQRKVLPMAGYFGSFKGVSNLKTNDPIVTEPEIIQIS